MKNDLKCFSWAGFNIFLLKLVHGDPLLVYRLHHLEFKGLRKSIEYHQKPTMSSNKKSTKCHHTKNPQIISNYLWRKNIICSVYHRMHTDLKKYLEYNGKYYFLFFLVKHIFLPLSEVVVKPTNGFAFEYFCWKIFTSLGKLSSSQSMFLRNCELTGITKEAASPSS